MLYLHHLQTYSSTYSSIRVADTYIVRYHLESPSRLQIQRNLSIVDTTGTQHCLSCIERCPKFRGRFVHSSMWLGLQTVSSLERCPLFSVLYGEVPLYTHQLTQGPIEYLCGNREDEVSASFWLCYSSDH